MRSIPWKAVVTIVLALAIVACGTNGTGNDTMRQPSVEGEGEHAGESGEGHAEGAEGEEGGTYIGRTEHWDAERRGVRLQLHYDASTDQFVGSVTNTTDSTICAVRVEVHLAGGPELGPTPRNDMQPGQTRTITLSTGGSTVGDWTAHPEMSACD